MAQLPPKIPNMTHNWPSFPHQRVTSSFRNSNSNNNVAASNLQSTWVDEFLDFSAVRRGAHRRSISDSVAFLDPPSMNMSESTFDRLDDEQLMSMFSDDIISVPVPPPASSSNPSTPSDQNSNNDENKTTPFDHQHQLGEVESSCNNNNNKSSQQVTQSPLPPPASNADTIVDPKRVKRILANRQSAQRSRVRKLQYISELERSVTTLQTEVSALSPRVAFLDHQRLILNVDNSALKQRIAALAQDKIFKDAHQEALKKEIERLRQVYHQQNLKKMNNNNNAAAPSQQPMNTGTIGCTDN